MDAVRGIYHDGIIELIEKPTSEETAEVLIIFPQKTKKITEIYGLFKDMVFISKLKILIIEVLAKVPILSLSQRF